MTISPEFGAAKLFPWSELFLLRNTRSGLPLITSHVNLLRKLCEAADEAGGGGENSNRGVQMKQ